MEEYTDRMHTLIYDGINFIYHHIKDNNLIDIPTIVVNSPQQDGEYIVYQDIHIRTIIKEKARKYFRITKEEKNINITPSRRKDIFYIRPTDMEQLINEIKEVIEKDTYRPYWASQERTSVVSTIKRKYPYTKKIDWDNIPEYRSVTFDNWKEEGEKEIKHQINILSPHLTLINMTKDNKYGKYTCCIKCDDEREDDFYIKLLIERCRNKGMTITKEKKEDKYVIEIHHYNFRR